MRTLHTPDTLAPMPGAASMPGIADRALVRPQAGGPVVQASELLGARRSVDIEYKGQRYRLQTTKAGKLILTK